MSNPCETEKRLIWNVKKWARILDGVASNLSQAPDRVIAQFQEYDFSNLTREQLSAVRSSVFQIPTDAHMIGISLRQIDEYAKQLSNYPLWSDEVAAKGNVFRSAYGSSKLRDMRNVLEHGAEYLAGKGDKPHLVVDPGGDWPGVLMINRKVERITVFGVEYDVKPVILAAIEFVKALPSVQRK